MAKNKIHHDPPFCGTRAKRGLTRNRQKVTCRECAKRHDRLLRFLRSYWLD